MSEFKHLGIDHVGIAVKDFEGAIQTYHDVLGFEVSGREVLADRGLQVAFVETGNSRIELLGALSDTSEISRFLDKRGSGVHHICVAVNNIDVAVTTMIERGATIIGDGVQNGAHNTRVAFLHPKSAHGVLLELVERRP